MTNRRRPHRYSVLCLLLIAGAASAGATTVVAIWTPARIVLAADTSLSRFDPATKTDVRQATVCKIREVGDNWYATAGLFEEPISGFALPDVAQAACERGCANGLSALHSAFDGILASALIRARDAVEARVRDSPNFNLADVIMAGRDGDSVAIIRSQVNVSSTIGASGYRPATAYQSGGVRLTGGAYLSGPAWIGRTDRIPSSHPAGTEMLAIGARDAIVEYQAQHPEWPSMDPLDAAKLFVNLEIARHPNAVGAPIAVLTIDKNGYARWAARPDVCQ